MGTARVLQMDRMHARTAHGYTRYTANERDSRPQRASGKSYSLSVNHDNRPFTSQRCALSSFSGFLIRCHCYRSVHHRSVNCPNDRSIVTEYPRKIRNNLMLLRARHVIHFSIKGIY
jgi:hypothetical protein